MSNPTTTVAVWVCHTADGGALFTVPRTAFRVLIGVLGPYVPDGASEAQLHAAGFGLCTDPAAVEAVTHLYVAWQQGGGR
jgi:hypothetical protein